MPIPSQNRIVEDLLAIGIIPQDCARWTVDAVAGGVVTMTAEVFISEKQFQLVADALLKNRDEALKAAWLVLKSRDRSKDDVGITLKMHNA